jgi:predicted metal-binding membrane protein
MPSVVDSWVRRDRIILSASLVIVVGLAWVYLIDMAWGMDMNMSMPAMRAWTTTDFILTFIMWSVMMIAMMTPSASPLVFLFAKLDRQRHSRRTPLATSWILLVGYLVIWSAFSAVATLAQWGLHTAALLSPMMATTSDLLGGLLLFAAGIFQLTPLKQACLSHCRSPLGFLMAEWRDGLGGAFVMGLKHGTYCVGCCWALMALLFVAGVMNLLWVAIIAGFVLIEKIVPAGHWLGRAAGILLIAWGSWIVVAVFI